MIQQIWEHIKYTLRHKWFVMIECFKVGLIWQGLIHDWDKFLPSSLIGYGETFFNPDGTRKKVHDASGHYDPTIQGSEKFRYAWLRHIRVNKHHWQYWVLSTENGEMQYDIPQKYLLEMLCDWKGASKALGISSVKQWWIANEGKMKLSQVSWSILDNLIGGENGNDE